MPRTTPVLLPTEATLVLLLVQVPPDVALLKVVVAPVHTTGVPVMGLSIMSHDT